jgi:hypothetical protein
MSTKYPSPLLGYNKNVLHKGRVFHIQTEDSGVKYGHIITHLFVDGGRILKSVKTSYAEYVGSERMTEVVREMMKQQHKAMFIALRDGKFNARADATTDSGTAPRARSDEPSATTHSDASALVGGAPAAAHPNQRLDQAAPQVTAAPAHPDSRVDDDGGTPSTLPEPTEELTLDIDALERATAVPSAPSPGLRPASDLPPPPPNIFRGKTAAGAYSVAPLPPDLAPGGSPRSASPAGPRAARPPSPAPPPTTPGRRPSQATAIGERRYAPTRPASIFGQARPQQGKSIFGEDVIGDKSLDEVILSYLAEDLEGEKK